MTTYGNLRPSMRPVGTTVGCPHDGLGCTGGQKCSINSADDAVRLRAWNATEYGRDFKCAKHEWHSKRSDTTRSESPHGDK